MISVFIGIFIFAVCCFPMFKVGSDEDELMGLDFGGNNGEGVKNSRQELE